MKYFPKMKNLLFLTTVLFLFTCGNRVDRDESIAETAPLTRYVDPMIGSDYHGHVFVGANVPFGAVQLGPNNFYKGWDWSSGYHYSDSIVIGFSHTHLTGTGCADLGDILIMPTTGDLITNAGTQENHLKGYASRYSHKNETVGAGYYSLLLNRYNIKAELTATERVGLHKYTFPESAQSRIIVDLKEGIADVAKKTYLKKVDNQTIVGYRISNGWSMDQRIYFALKISKPIEEFVIYNDSLRLNEAEEEGDALKGILNFKTNAGEVVLLKVGISPVCTENALQNIETEAANWDFDAYHTKAIELWASELNKIKAEADSTILRTFYTALYHTMIAPSLYNDNNGDYLGADKKQYNSKTFKNYTTFSLWDTYRAANPLFTLIQQERVPDFINSMLELYKQEGKLPEWHLMGHDNRVMIGYNAVPIIVDAYFKGFKGFDTQLAYEAVVKTAMRDDRGVDFIKEIGYIPFDKQHESVAKAMEYAIYDWGIAQMAEDLGKTEDYEYFSKRSKYYKNYFDASNGFFKGKNADGSWRKDFNPITSSHRTDEFCEGNGWQYLWLVPQDVEGLIELLGGEKAFIKKLDSLFVIKEKLEEGASADISGLIGMYAHGNEPGHHITYLYAYAGEQWKTAEKVRQIMKEMYTDKPDGLCGNEDCGQMSAWYIWSAMGFYPVNPQNGAYVFGSPLLDEAEIACANNKTFKIIAHNNNDKNIYIQSVKLNGMDYTKSFITHKDIQQGGTLEFFMGSQPNKAFGAGENDRPKSIIY